MLFRSLLIAIGNHGVGKTNFLASIVDGRCKIVSNHTYRTVPLLLSAYDKEVFIELLDTIDDFSSFINNENDIVNKEMVLQRIPTKEMLLSKQSPYFLAYRRLVILQLLLKSEANFAGEYEQLDEDESWAISTSHGNILEWYGDDKKVITKSFSIVIKNLNL